MKPLLAALVAVGIVGTGITVGVMKYGSSKTAEPTSVRVESVARGNLVEIVSAPGQVQPKTKVQISARVAARILELPFDEGAQVKAGEVLVRLDATELEAQLRASQARAAGQRAQLQESAARVKAQEAQIEASRIMLLDAQRDYKRQTEIKRFVSQAVVDAAQAKADQLAHQLESSIRQLEANKLNLVVLKHNIEAAEADIVRAKDNLAYTTIASPIDGIVTRLNGKVGELVVTGTMNNAGTVIMEVSDLSEMQVDAQVDESNIAAVKDEQKAKIRIAAYPEELFDGVVKLVGLDTADQQQNTRGGGGGSQMQGKWYRARVVLDTKGRRIPAGLSADVDIETHMHRNVIKVPTQAVMGRPLEELPASVKDRPEVDKDKTLVTVVFTYDGNGKAVMTPVVIAAGDMTHTVITSGLSDGDRIITGPYKVLPELKDGQEVKEQEATTQPAKANGTRDAATQPTDLDS